MLVIGVITNTFGDHIIIIIKATEIKVKNIKEAIFPATSDARNPKGVKDVRDNDQRYDQTFDGYGPALHQRPFDRTAYKPSPYLPYAGRIAVVWSFRRR